MITMNENYGNLMKNYLFSTIQKKVDLYQKEYPNKKLIKLGIGDVTKPLPDAILQAMHQAVNDLGNQDTFHGYGPEQGYPFLKNKIIQYDYLARNISLKPQEIFISDGAKCDCANIAELFSDTTTVGIVDPVYPVYLDSNVMCGRSGKFDTSSNQYTNIHYIPIKASNNFIPEIPTESIDMIYLCYPNNPTGTVLSRDDLKKWVDYALQHHSIILFDSAYEAFISDDTIPHSIYEIEHAKEVAIECRSFSKTAGFTGVRCAYTVVPEELMIHTNSGEKVSVNELWNRRQCTKFNGASYLSQRAAEATYLEEGQIQIRKNINDYMQNTTILLQGLKNAKMQVYGGVHSPYIWLKTPNNMTSWEFFDYLLTKANVIGTPGSGFGNAGEGYFRLTGFGNTEETKQALERILACI